MTSVDDLITLFEEEFAALSSGNYTVIPDLAARKEAIHRQGLDESGIPPETLVRLSELGERNARLLDAARRGFASAQMDIREIRRGLGQSTYDQGGRRNSLSAAPGRLERKL